MGDKNTHLSDSTLKPTVCDAEATCAATAIETTEMYLQMERISEILTQEEETKWVNVDQQKNIYHFAGISHTNEPLEVQRVSDTQKHGTKWECLSQPTFSGVITFPRSWHGSPGSHSLFAMSWPSLCPHKHQEKHICHVPVEEIAEQNLQLPTHFHPPKSKLGCTDPKTRLSHALGPCTTSSTFLNHFMVLLQPSHHNSFFFWS